MKPSIFKWIGRFLVEQASPSASARWNTIARAFVPLGTYHAILPENKAHYRFLMKWIKMNLSREDSILEVGCGAGLFGLWLKKESYKHYTGVDINRRLIDIGTQVTGLDLRVMDGTDLEFEDKSYDFVGYMNCFCQYKDNTCEKFIKEGLRVARKWAEFDAACGGDINTRAHTCARFPSKSQVSEWSGDRIAVCAELEDNRRLYIAEVSSRASDVG